MNRPVLVLFSLLVPGAVTAALVACAAKPSGEDIRVVGPNVQDFTAPCLLDEAGTGKSCGVSAMLERRCGSLDCHGYVRRPLRIYSRYGLRLPPPDLVGATPSAEGGAVVNEPGGVETTPEEKSANYRSVVGVEPEKTELVAKASEGPDTLLIYKKPLGIEGHKGGIAINKGDDAEECLVTWLRGTTNKAACGKASDPP